MKRELDSQKHQHDMRVSLIKEKGRDNEKDLEVMRKAFDEVTRKQQKELRVQKKQELASIENFIKQENNKVLMAMEDGERLERVILDMYKRY